MRRTIGLFAALALVAGLVVQTIFAPAASATPQTFTDTTTANFDAGNTADSAAVTDTGDGSVAMQPGSANFNGTTLPDGWTATGAGTATVSGGQLHVDGASVYSGRVLRVGETVMFNARFDVPGQTVGFGGSGTTAGFVGLGVTTTSGGVTELMGYGGGTNYPLSSTATYLHSLRTYKIQWNTYGQATLSVLNSSGAAVFSSLVSNNQPGSSLLQISDSSVDGKIFNVDYASVVAVQDSTTDFSTMNGWTPSSYLATVSGGMLSLNGGSAMGQTAYPAGTYDDIFATFSGKQFQQAGWKAPYGTTSPIGNPAAAFFEVRPGPGSTPIAYLYASDGNTVCQANGTLSFNPTGVQHDYRVEVRSNSVVFSIPDVSSFVPYTCIGLNMTQSLSTWAISPAEPTGYGMTVDAATVTHPVYENNDFASFPATWSTTVLKSGGTATISSGQLVANDVRTSSNQTYSAGHSVDFWAKFTGAANQTVGWGETLAASGQSQGTITTGSSGGTLSTNADGTTTALPTSLLGSLHHYRIDWTGSSYTFNVLDVSGISPITTASAAFNGKNLRPVVSDSNTSADAVSVDSLQVSPITSDTTSRIFDAGVRVPWNNLTYTANTPTNTGVTLAVRAGDTPNPDASWSSWATTTSGGNPGVTGRYAQYRIIFSTTDDWALPSVSYVSLTTGNPSTPAYFTDTTNADFSAGTAFSNTTVASIGNGAVTLNNGYTMPTGGTSPDPSWTFTNPSNVTMSGGAMYVDGTDGIQTGVQFGAPRTLTFNATMSGNNEQQIGFKETVTPSGDYSAAAWFDYAPYDGKMYIETNDETPITGGWQGRLGGISLADIPGSTHNFTINYYAGGATFYVDSTYIGALAMAVTNTPMSPFVYDSADTVPLVINGENVSQATTGTFVSRVLGDGVNTIGGPVSWTATTPTGTGLTVQVRTGNTATPDSSWSTFETVTNGSSPAYGGKYAQYQGTLTTTNTSFPDLEDITFTGYP